MAAQWGDAPHRTGEQPRQVAVSDLWCSSECTPPCQGGGRGFKSRQVRHQIRLWLGRRWVPGRVAQLVERAPEKREVTGSTPVPTTGNFLIRGCLDQWAV